MKYLLLILSMLMIINILDPKILKLGTVKATVNSVLETYKYKKHNVIVALTISFVIAIIYCILLAVYIKTFIFTLVMTYWIAQIIYEFNMVFKYIEDGNEGVVFNSYIYKWGSRIIDFIIYGYVIHFIMIHW